MKPIYRVEGYTLTYFLNGKIFGQRTIAEPDRKEFGFQGGIDVELTEDVIIGKKTLKKGTIVRTELTPIMGRIIN
jgi:hypothetical protein